MSERELEKMFRLAVKAAGGCAYKFVSPGMSGVPDRLVVLPDNCIGFVELKAPGKKSRPEQCYQQCRLENMGCYVAVLDDPDMIEQIIREIREYGIADEDVLGDIRKVGGMI